MCLPTLYDRHRRVFPSLQNEMTEAEAISLIRPAVQNLSSAQTWADLGAGGGTFTQALSSQLPEHSTIYAIDQNPNSLSLIRLSNKNVRLVTKTANFEELISELNSLDGILMANSLHYVRHQVDFLQRVKTALNQEGLLIIVEYDRRTANAWVPFPLPHDKLVAIGESAGFSVSEKVSKRASAFDGVEMYSCVLRPFVG